MCDPGVCRGCLETNRFPPPKNTPFNPQIIQRSSLRLCRGLFSFIEACIYGYFQMRIVYKRGETCLQCG